MSLLVFLRYGKTRARSLLASVLGYWVPFILTLCIMDNCNLAPNITFSSINCNSLNMSASTSSAQKLKLYGIAKLSMDIVFLADVRISNRQMVSALSEVNKTFRINPYASYTGKFNSTQNKRGVGILYKVCLNITEIRTISDPEENFLLNLVKIEGKTIIIGAVYGPNDNNVDFFRKLSNGIKSLGNYPVILGGDWNCTLSTDGIENNIDCLNMQQPPP